MKKSELLTLINSQQVEINELRERMTRLEARPIIQPLPVQNPPVIKPLRWPPTGPWYKAYYPDIKSNY